MDLISKTLHYIGKNCPNASVVQVGAMDGISFDDTRGFLDMYKWKALLVEPVPALFNELKENFKDRENYIFEQCAITEYDGEVAILTVSPEIIKRENLHPGYKGMSALYPLKNGFGSDYQRDIDVKQQFGVNLTVPALTLNSLFKKHNIESFDVFICDAEGHDWNIFKQLDLTKYRPKFIRLEYMNLSDEEKRLMEDKLVKANYTVEIGQDIDAVPNEFLDEMGGINKTSSIDPLMDIKEQINSLNKEQREIVQKYLNSPLPLNITPDLTIVTGLWNVGRAGRDFEHYLLNFQKFLEIPANLFIYVPKELEHLVWEKRSRDNTHVRLFELEDVKNLYAPFWDKTQEIRTNPEWYNQTGWLPGSPQASNEWYNPIVQSKMFMLHDAKIINPFNTDYLLWLDAGITNTVHLNYWVENRCLDKIIPYLKTFLFLSYPYETTTEIHGFDLKGINRYAHEPVKYVCRGGLFGGHKDFITQANSTYYSTLQSTLNEGLMGTEESIFSIMAYLEPHIYRRYALDDNGLILKFTQALIDDSVELEDNGARAHVLPKGTYSSTDKTSLYMLTFNFPEQIEHTLETWKANSPEWLEKPRKILIDNSTNEEARKGNKIIADKYGFEHIVMEKNGGICGGRMFAAEHFQESDSDYYFFFEDDMGFYPVDAEGQFCRNGFRKYIPNLYQNVHEIMAKEDFDFLKLSFTEVYMDNNIQVSWYNVPQSVRSAIWSTYDQLPVTGLDPYTPRTKFDRIDSHNGLAYITGEIYYANWPMIVSRKGNQKMFLDTKWAHPYEQTWMSYMFQETLKGNLNPAVLLASPVWHNRIVYYKPEERREN